MLRTLYARKVPTYERQGEHDVQLAKDAAFSQVMAQIRWDKTNKPDRRNKYVTLNCWRWRLVWLESLANVKKALGE